MINLKEKYFNFSPTVSLTMMLSKNLYAGRTAESLLTVQIILKICYLQAKIWIMILISTGTDQIQLRKYKITIKKIMYYFVLRIRNNIFVILHITYPVRHIYYS